MNLSLNEPENIAMFRKLVAAMTSLAPQLELRFSPSGLSCQGMDNCQVCLFDLVLTAGWFEEYDCAEESLTIVVYGAILEKVLTMHSSGQRLCLSSAAGGEHLDITMSSADDACKKEYTLPIFTEGKEVITLPSTDNSDIEVTLRAASLSSLIKQLGQFGSNLRVSVSHEAFSLSASGENGDMTVSVKIDDDDISASSLGIEEYSACECSTYDGQFSFRHLKFAVLCDGIASDVRMYLDSESPLALTYELEQSSRIQFLVAPRV